MSDLNVKALLITEYRQAEDDQQRGDCLKRLLSYSDETLNEHANEIEDTIASDIHSSHAGLRHRIIRLLRCLGHAVAVDELGYAMAVVK